MTGTPCWCALVITVAADGLSRLTISSALTPSLSIWSAIVANFALSPLAFWMSDCTPAALNAAARNGRSAFSQRAEDWVSGRITPTFSLAAGVAVPAAPPLLDEESLPHAATPSIRAPAAPTATTRFNIFCESFRCFGGAARAAFSAHAEQHVDQQLVEA